MAYIFWLLVASNKPSLPSSWFGLCKPKFPPKSMGRVAATAGRVFMHPSHGLLLFQTFCVCNLRKHGNTGIPICGQSAGAPKGDRRLSNSPKASSQHPGCSNLGTKGVELSLGLVPPFSFLGPLVPSSTEQGL